MPDLGGRRLVLRLVVSLTAILFVACGSSSNSEDPHGADAQSQSYLDRARQSEEFVAAEEAVKQCMEDKGYVGDPTATGVTLKDGSLLLYTTGEGRIITGAYLDYLVAQEDCEVTVGFPEIAARHGLVVGPTDSNNLRQINERMVMRMTCMEAKGWPIPEPVMQGGTLIYDIYREAEEERVAWATDYTQCNMELFGNPTGWE